MGNTVSAEGDPKHVVEDGASPSALVETTEEAPERGGAPRTVEDGTHLGALTGSAVRENTPEESARAPRRDVYADIASGESCGSESVFASETVAPKLVASTSALQFVSRSATVLRASPRSTSTSARRICPPAKCVQGTSYIGKTVCVCGCVCVCVWVGGCVFVCVCVWSCVPFV
jgi:hypothetical protein